MSRGINDTYFHKTFNMAFCLTHLDVECPYRSRRERFPTDFHRGSSRQSESGQIFGTFHNSFEPTNHESAKKSAAELKGYMSISN